MGCLRVRSAVSWPGASPMLRRVVQRLHGELTALSRNIGPSPMAMMLEAWSGEGSRNNEKKVEETKVSARFIDKAIIHVCCLCQCVLPLNNSSRVREGEQSIFTT